jgi:glutaredoxin
MRIEVLGDGCSKCDLLKSKVQQALDELDLQLEVHSVMDPERLTELHTLSLPQLVINGQMSSTKSSMSVAEIKELLSISMD